ncbi:DUF3450 family protein [Pontiellaceae bacterium B12219]|nr:DUF3450 family protein [Pontiellaceae bacterium B12219]
MTKKKNSTTALLFLCAGPSFSSPSVPPEEAREKLYEWVQIKKIISAESAEWQTEKMRLSDLNSIRLQEIGKLDELLARSESARTLQTEKHEQLNRSFTMLKAQQEELRLAIATLEKQLRPLLNRLPPPLQKKRAAEIARLEQRNTEIPLSDRYRELLLLLTEIGEFNQTITLDQHILELENQRVEVDVLYLGLSQAWYLNRNGTHAGYAFPASKGWNWIPDPSSAPAIRAALQIAEKQVAPDFAALTLHPLDAE